MGFFIAFFHMHIIINCRLFLAGKYNRRYNV